MNPIQINGMSCLFISVDFTKQVCRDDPSLLFQLQIWRQAAVWRTGFAKRLCCHHKRENSPTRALLSLYGLWHTQTGPFECYTQGRHATPAALLHSKKTS